MMIKYIHRVLVVPLLHVLLVHHVVRVIQVIRSHHVLPVVIKVISLFIYKF